MIVYVACMYEPLRRNVLYATHNFFQDILGLGLKENLDYNQYYRTWSYHHSIHFQVYYILTAYIFLSYFIYNTEMVPMHKSRDRD
jgi:hypothetical protein